MSKHQTVHNDSTTQVVGWVAYHHRVPSGTRTLVSMSEEMNGLEMMLFIWVGFSGLVLEQQLRLRPSAAVAELSLSYQGVELGVSICYLHCFSIP